MDPGTFVIHTDGLNRRIGHTASGILDEIPDAARVRSLTGALDPDWIEPVEYYLPPGPYTVELINPTTGDLGYRLFAGDALFSLETSGLEPAMGEVSNQPDGGAFSFVARTPLEGIQLRVARTLGVEEERALDLTGVPLPVDGALRINSMEGGSGFQVTFEGTEMALGDLILTEASPAGILSLPLPGIPLMEGASLTVEPFDWGRLTETPVFGRRLMPDGRILLTAYNLSLIHI